VGSELRLHLSEDGADAERLDAMTGFLRHELLQLDVEDVTAADQERLVDLFVSRHAAGDGI
jgi:hypothetical protein